MSGLLVCSNFCSSPSIFQHMSHIGEPICGDDCFSHLSFVHSLNIPSVREVEALRD